MGWDLSLAHGIISTRQSLSPAREGSKLMVDNDSMGHSLQFVGAQFSNFILRKLSCDFKLPGMSKLHKFQMVIFP